MGVVNHGTTELANFYSLVFDAFPDFKIELTSHFVAGKWAGAEWLMTGTHQGDLPGLPATNNPFSLRGASVFELQGTSFHVAKTEGEIIMSKVIFVLYRRADLTREQMAEHWSGQQHTSIVNNLPGLTRWIQNHVTSAPGEPICDGIGELWFSVMRRCSRLSTHRKWVPHRGCQALP
jgi:hypothetical protein